MWIWIWIWICLFICICIWICIRISISVCMYMYMYLELYLYLVSGNLYLYTVNGNVRFTLTPDDSRYPNPCLQVICNHGTWHMRYSARQSLRWQGSFRPTLVHVYGNNGLWLCAHNRPCTHSSVQLAPLATSPRAEATAAGPEEACCRRAAT